jgi:hypothetical protein
MLRVVKKLFWRIYLNLLVCCSTSIKDFKKHNAEKQRNRSAKGILELESLCKSKCLGGEIFCGSTKNLMDENRDAVTLPTPITGTRKNVPEIGLCG